MLHRTHGRPISAASRVWAVVTSVLIVSAALAFAPGQSRPAAGASPTWSAEYYTNNSLSGSPALTRQDPAIDFDWGSGSPDPSIGADNFSARWTRSIAFAAGRYRFTTTTDDGVRLYVDGALVLDHWVPQSPTSWSTELDLAAGDHVVVMEFFEDGGGAMARLGYEPVTSGTGGWTGEYFSNSDLAGTPVLTRQDAAIDFQWNQGSPAPGIPADYFSVRWTRSWTFAAGRYRFVTTTDDGVRLYVDGALLIDKWVGQSSTSWTAELDLTSGPHSVRMEYMELAWDAVAKLAVTDLGPPTIPGAPTIMEPATDGQVAHPADVHMETAAPTRLGHVCTDWEIVLLSSAGVVWSAPCDSLNRLHIHLGDGQFVNAYAGRTELAYDTSYMLRARHRFSSGEPEWTGWAERRFVTATAPAPGTAVAWTVRQPGYVVEPVVSGLQLPVNIAFVPNPGIKASSPYFYVTELYGTIKVVSRDGTVSDYIRGTLNYRPSGIFPGSGEEGLTGIVVDPATGDVFASMLYEAYPGGPHYPKVMRFHSNHSGAVSGSYETILDMVGEAQGPSHQVSNLSFGPDGKLYVHIGDGFVPATAQDLNSFQGKILRINLDGSPATDNPFYSAADGISARDYVVASGFRNPFGGDWRAADGQHYIVENGPSVDRLAKLVAGRNYLFDGTDASMRNYAIHNWSPAVAPVNAVFIEPGLFGGSGFPAATYDHLFVSESGPTWATGPQTNGKRISEFALDAAGNRISGPTPLVEYTGTGKATVAALAAGPDGLYFSDLYRDLGATSPIDAGAQILRIRYVGVQPPPNQPPTVALTKPANGEQFAAPATIAIEATASDSDGTIARVEFFNGPTKLGEDTSAPFTFTWNAVGAGSYSLTARAWDDDGANTTSAATAIVVKAAPDFTVAASPGSASVKRGDPGKYTVTLTPQNGFTGDVQLSVVGLPSGVTASFSPASLTLGTSATSTLTVTTAAGSPIGTFQFTIRATSGALSHDTNVTIRIRR